MKLYVRGYSSQYHKIIETLTREEIVEAIENLRLIDIVSKAAEYHNPPWNAGTANISLDDLEEIRGYGHQSGNSSFWDCDIDLFHFDQHYYLTDLVDDTCEICLTEAVINFIGEGFSNEEALEEAEDVVGLGFCEHYTEEQAIDDNVASGNFELDWDSIHSQLDNYFAEENWVCESQENCDNCGNRLSYAGFEEDGNRIFSCPYSEYADDEESRYYGCDTHIVEVIEEPEKTKEDCLTCLLTVSNKIETNVIYNNLERKGYSPAEIYHIIERNHL